MPLNKMIPHKAFLWNLGVLSLVCTAIIINVTFSHERIIFGEFLMERLLPIQS